MVLVIVMLSVVIIEIFVIDFLFYYFLVLVKMFWFVVIKLNGLLDRCKFYLYFIDIFFDFWLFIF